MLICFSINDEWFLCKWHIELLSGHKAILIQRRESKGNIFVFQENLYMKLGCSGFSGFISFSVTCLCCFVFLYLQVKGAMLYLITSVVVSFSQHLCLGYVFKKGKSILWLSALWCYIIWCIFIYIPPLQRMTGFAKRKQDIHSHLFGDPIYAFLMC